jgi:hypothetical protein
MALPLPVVAYAIAVIMELGVGACFSSGIAPGSRRSACGVLDRGRLALPQQAWGPEPIHSLMKNVMIAGGCCRSSRSAQPFSLDSRFASRAGS